MTGKHKRRRRVFGLPLVVVLVLGGALTAVALFVYTLFISGTVNVGDGTIHWNDGDTVSTLDGSCTGTYASNTDLDIAWDAFPEETCTLQAAFDGPSSTNTISMALQDITVPPELEAALGADCGKIITAAEAGTPGVTLQFRVPAGAVVGSTITLTADTFGLEWVKASEYVPGNCTVSLP